MMVSVSWQDIWLHYPQWIDAIAALIVLVIVINIVRFMVTWAGRITGLYSPDHYHYWSHLPWRFFYAIGQKIVTFYEFVFLLGRRGNTGGFSSWLQTLSLLYTPDKLHLGRATAFGLGLLQPVGVKITRHAFFLAMTGSGKTTALITMIALWRGSVFFVDPKAQIINALAKCDRKRQWFVLDVYGISNIKSACFNVFDCIKEAIQREGEAAAVLWAMRIAEAIIVTPNGSTPYFYETSRQFLAGLILHVLTYHDEDEHNLAVVRDLIVHGYKLIDKDGKEETKGDEPHELLLRIMADNPSHDGFIAGAISSLQSSSGETSGNIRSTLQEQTKWLDLPQVRNVIKTSDFSLAELKTRDDRVLAFAAELSSLREELSRFSRLLTNMTYYTFQAVKEKKGQCLTVIDELPSQQYNPTLEIMLAAARSMGQTFVGISQNIELMRLHYPKSWKSFISESDVCFWMGGNHPDNADMLSSKLLGKKTIIKKDGRSGRKIRRDIEVMTSEQVSRYLDPDSDRLIVTRASGRSLLLRNDPYYKALPVWRYKADPEHGDTWLRAVIRCILRQ